MMPTSRDDSRYLIPGTDIFNFTAWSRDNIPKDPPRRCVGDRVKVVIETTITAVGQDCCGSILYGLDRTDFSPNGWDEDSLLDTVEQG